MIPAEFWQVALMHLLAVASPGPDFALILKQSVVHGRRVALRTSWGIGTGILLHVAYSLLGLGLLLKSSPVWFSLIKYAGAAYIAWLGLNALRSRPREPAGLSDATRPNDVRSAFAVGFLTNALNVKATLFFISLYALGVSPDTPKWIQAGYGLWMAVATAAWFSSLSVLLTRPEVRQRFLRHGHWIDRALGVVFLAFAVSIAFAATS